ncbi:nucleoside triphosphate pyrophosphohydrolase family protein [Nocardia transvalensis]|uniref:nucleoside triphosphate pyrophosphohydrolase family protein n=1 Tax=Nocardia transvalensis TaxID=37333 RepID=UPI002B4B10EF|nr:nucleoside triphosphate pyrophosphohydrolase family protein [Nocardia transvalensis]
MSRARTVAEFHKAFEHPVNTRVDFPDEATEKLRIKLLREEFREYRDAVAAGDMVEIADALADMAVIIEGTALAYGIPLEAAFREVMWSNMTKLGENGRPIYRRDGKIAKGPAYQPPDIETVLRLHGWEG